MLQWTFSVHDVSIFLTWTRERLCHRSESHLAVRSFNKFQWLSHVLAQTYSGCHTLRLPQLPRCAGHSLLKGISCAMNDNEIVEHKKVERKLLKNKFLENSLDNFTS